MPNYSRDVDKLTREPATPLEKAVCAFLFVVLCLAVFWVRKDARVWFLTVMEWW